DAVLSAIQKINKYNGCIIADSVGLGKTFEALAVIKYFELRQDNVLVLTPAKLYDNWSSFKGDYVDGPLNETFNYKIMFHTDLSRYKGVSKEGKDLSRFDWSKFDLIVIDESHNFRNRTENEDGSFTRYQRLLNAI
ncbi:DEAD/DEAH box helicase family protein, partial [Clostridium saudiense]|nr:DEAD/DEAH box helicase family protein [Clostridium saudiense]